MTPKTISSVCGFSLPVPPSVPLGLPPAMFGLINVLDGSAKCGIGSDGFHYNGHDHGDGYGDGDGNGDSEGGVVIVMVKVVLTVMMMVMWYL